MLNISVQSHIESNTTTRLNIAVNNSYGAVRGRYGDANG